MGKAANNEKLKLRATFLNNIAVAFLITGFVVPYLAFAYKAAEHGAQTGRQRLPFFEGMMTAFTHENIGAAIVLATVAIASVVVATILHAWANAVLDKITD